MAEVIIKGSTLPARITQNYYIIYEANSNDNNEPIIMRADKPYRVYNKSLVKKYLFQDPKYFIMDGEKYDIVDEKTNDDDGYTIYWTIINGKSYKICLSGYRKMYADLEFPYNEGSYIAANVEIVHDININNGTFDYVNAQYMIDVPVDMDPADASLFPLKAVPVMQERNMETGEAERNDKQTNPAKRAKGGLDIIGAVRTFFKTAKDVSLETAKRQFSMDNAYNVYVKGEDVCQIADVSFQKALDHMKKNKSKGATLAVPGEPEAHINVDRSGVKIISKDNSISMENNGDMFFRGKQSSDSLTSTRPAVIPIDTYNNPTNDILPHSNIFMTSPPRMPDITKIRKEITFWERVAKIAIFISGGVVQTVNLIDEYNKLSEELGQTTEEDNEDNT